MFVDDLNLVLEIVREKGHKISKVFFKIAMELAKKENSAELAYELALIVENGKNKDIENKRAELCKVVVNSQNPKFAYLYARDIPKADIQSLQKVVEVSKNAEYATEFAADIYGIDITNLQQVVLESKEPNFAYRFAKYVENCDVKSLENIVAKSKDIELIQKFVNDIEGANVKRLNSIKRDLVKKDREKSFKL